MTSYSLPDPFNMTQDRRMNGPVASIILSAVGSYVSGVTILGIQLTGFAAAAATLLVGAALYAIQSSLTKSNTTSGYELRNYKSSNADYQIIYGQVRVGAVIGYENSTGNENLYLHRVLLFAGHEIDDYVTFYINDEEVTSLSTDGDVAEVTDKDGNTSTKYSGYIRINPHYGTDDQEADQDLVSDVEEWTDSHRLRGLAYVYVRFKFNQDVFPNGAPTITATIKGKKVYDPRTDTIAWSSNPALCMLDYTISDFGLNEQPSKVDMTSIQTAANICDQTDTLAGDTRFTCNGAFTTDVSPDVVYKEMTKAMAGYFWNSQGFWRMKAGAWTDSVLSLNADDIRGSIQLSTRHSRSDNFNTVSGTFRGEETGWVETEYPEVTSTNFIEEDNDEVFKTDLSLPFCSFSVESRRIARIYLERNREQLVVQVPFSLKALGIEVGDVIDLTLDRFGWESKTFEVVEWNLNFESKGDGLVCIVDTVLREISSTVFNEFDDGKNYTRNNTTLESPFYVPDVGITLSNEAVVYRERLVNQLTATISCSESSRVMSVEVLYKKSSESTWISAGSGDLGNYKILDLDVDSYDVRARAINIFGSRGNWTFQTNYEVDATSDAPANVTGFDFTISSGTAFFSWEPVPDLDLSYYQIKRSVSEKTNMLPHSVANDSNSTWALGTSGTLTVSSVTGLQGSLQASTKLVPNTTDQDHNIVGTMTGLSTNTEYTLFVIAEPAGYDWVYCGLNGSGFKNGFSFFDVSNGLVGWDNGSTSRQGIVDRGDGTYLCWVTATTKSTAGSFQAAIYVCENGVELADRDFAGDGTSGVIIHHACVISGTPDISVLGDSSLILTEGATASEDYAEWGSASTVVKKVARPSTSIAVPAFAGSYLIRAYDKGGNPSEYAAMATIKTTDLPTLGDTTTITENPSFSGTNDNTTVDTTPDPDELILDAISSSTNNGTYLFSTYIDVTTPRTVTVSSEIEFNRHWTDADDWDSIPGNFDDLPDAWDTWTNEQANYGDIAIEVFVAATDDDPNGTSPVWGGWQLVTGGNLVGRGFKFKAVLKSTNPNVSPSVSVLKATVGY